MTKSAQIIFSIHFVLILLIFIQCSQNINSEHPALVYVECPIDRNDLCVAYFEGNTVHKKKIISAEYISVSQLDDAIFLIRAQHNTFIWDATTDQLKKLIENKELHCLRTIPKRKIAMLVYARGSEIELYELYFDNLEMNYLDTLSQVLRIKKLPYRKFSPDLKHIASMRLKKRGDHLLPSWVYTLVLHDVSTMETTVLDSNIQVAISGFSSLGWGVPPFEWIDEDEIIYQHMALSEGYTILEIVNIDSKEISEHIHKDIDLRLSGGSLEINPFNGKIIYNGYWIVDLNAKTLTPRYGLYSITSERDSTTVLYGKKAIFRGNGTCINRCISASNKHFAWSVRPNSKTLDVRIFAKVKGVAKPIMVAEGPCYPTRPIAWIENARGLKKHLK